MAKAGRKSKVSQAGPATCGRARCAIAGWAAVIAGLCNASAGHTSAFFIRDQSAAALGNAFAGTTAGADDITYMFFNGAALARHQGSHVASVGTYTLSRAKYTDGEASTVQGVAVEGGEGGRNGAGGALIPALYALWDLSDSFMETDGLALGIAVNAPFGFETEYEDGWIGRYYALQSRVRSINLNPVVTYEPVPGVAFALGAQAQYIDAKLTNALDFGTLGALNRVSSADPAGQDGFAKLKGDDWGFGYTAGLLLEPWPGTRIGAAYRSSIRHELEGDARIRLDSAGVGATLGAAAGTTAAKAGLTTPEIVSFGAYHEIDSAWAVMADASWTRWSRLRVLRVEFDGASQADDMIEEDWRDTWFFALGCTYRPTRDWAIRSGVGYDQSPSRNRTRTPRTPINNGILLSFGADYALSPALELAFGYSHYFIESARIDLRADAPGNAARGNLRGSSENAVDTLSLQFRWAF
jgi:long-chain fatty acid transport protein